MNKTTAIGAVIVLLIIVVAAAYVLLGNKASAPYIPATSTVAASAYTTTMAPSNTAAPATTTVAGGSSSYSVELETNATYGQYLANASGFTLYVYMGDVPNSGLSSCGGGCANVWPPFYAANLTVAPGLNASNFAVINRTGSGVTQQLAYKGWPLYRYVQDTGPGQIAGNGIANFQVAVK